MLTAAALDRTLDPDRNFLLWTRVSVFRTATIKFVMVRQLEAVYEHGVLRPLEPLALPEHQRVRLTLEDQAAPQDSVASVTGVNERREEFQWLAKKSGPYAGQW